MSSNVTNKLMGTMLTDLYESFADYMYNRSEGIVALMRGTLDSRYAVSAAEANAKYEYVRRLLMSVVWEFLTEGQLFRLAAVLENFAQLHYWANDASDMLFQDGGERLWEIIGSLRYKHYDWEIVKYVMAGPDPVLEEHYCPNCRGSANYRSLPEKTKMLSLGEKSCECMSCRISSTRQDIEKMEKLMEQVRAVGTEWELMDDEELIDVAIEFNASIRDAIRVTNRVLMNAFRDANVTSKRQMLREAKYWYLYRTGDNGRYIYKPIEQEQ